MNEDELANPSWATADWQNLGRQLRCLREKAGLSRTTAATQVDLRPEVLARYEDGTMEPFLDDMVGLAELYGVGLQSLAESAGLVRVEATQTAARGECPVRGAAGLLDQPSHSRQNKQRNGLLASGSPSGMQQAANEAQQSFALAVVAADPGAEAGAVARPEPLRRRRTRALVAVALPVLLAASFMAGRSWEPSGFRTSDLPFEKLVLGLKARIPDNRRAGLLADLNVKVMSGVEILLKHAEGKGVPARDSRIYLLHQFKQLCVGFAGHLKQAPGGATPAQIKLRHDIERLSSVLNK